MSKQEPNTNVRSNRLEKAKIEENFSDLHPPFTRSEALIEADRCYFCYDAPCTTACPTDIDIPGFIQKIRSDNIKGSAHTILRENIMGGMCARVCPTEILCEEACVRNTHEEKPVNIGLLQRYATDPVFADRTQLFERADSSGKKVAVIGGGPAGLSCAHRLSMLGHDVVVFNRDDKAGGLNEYGIAAYKAVDDFAQREVDYILSIGGIELRNGVALGTDISLAELRDEYDAVFIGLGLAAVNELGLPNEDLPGVESAIDYIAELRQSEDLSSLPVGANVVVIGGGMTAIDIAVQSKRLGAEQVTLAYRRGPEQMGASEFEQQLAQTSGVTLQHWVVPSALEKNDDSISIELEKTELDNDGKLQSTGETVKIDADVVFKAIGQKMAEHDLDGIELQRGRIVVDESQATTLDNVWAGGDCVVGGEDLTVSAVQHGKIAAIAIDRSLRNG
ncbi:MAG: NAD(P)-dependent oxidoreductase [Woeseiaceae bacterium]